MESWKKEGEGGLTNLCPARMSSCQGLSGRDEGRRGPRMAEVEVVVVG